jgi:hypothetical protein
VSSDVGKERTDSNIKLSDPFDRRCEAWWQVPVGAQTAASRFLDCGSQSRRGYRCLFLVSVVFCQVEVTESGLSLIQRNPT